MNDLNNQMLSAAFQGDYMAVERMVDQGADINYVDHWETLQRFSHPGKAILWEWIHITLSEQKYHLKMPIFATLLTMENLNQLSGYWIK